MTFRFALASLLAAAFAYGAPMTLKELDFLVRQRVPEADILREITTRRLLAPVDAQTALALKENGASDALLARLNAPGLVLSPEEARAENQRQAMARQQAGQNQPDPARQTAAPKAVPGQQEDREAVRQMLADRLVRLDGDQLRPVEIAALRDVRIFAFYFGSMASADTRRFDPKLLAAYQRLKAQYPTQFEVIFVSGSRDEFNMGQHMRTVRMPWPAIRYGAVDERIAQLGSKGVPWVVAVAETGKVLTKDPLGSDRLESLAGVIEALEWLLARL
jgi:hypothetical protein